MDFSIGDRVSFGPMGSGTWRWIGVVTEAREDFVEMTADDSLCNRGQPQALIIRDEELKALRRMA